jgi:tripartite motif-containing protein 71
VHISGFGFLEKRVVNFGKRIRLAGSKRERIASIAVMFLLLLAGSVALVNAETYVLNLIWDVPGRGVAVDSLGNIFVLEYIEYNSHVHKFSSSGVSLTQWGSFGSGDGQLNRPWGIAVDGAGNVYVIDTWNGRVQKFNSSGAFLTKWGSQFNVPKGIAVDGAGNVYVADSGNSRVQKFNSTGAFLTMWGTKGSGDGQLDNPIGIGVDGAGNVYVADSGNSRIQKFNSTGAFLTKWGTKGTAEDNQLMYPYGIAVDGAGYVYVADNYGKYVKMFSSTGVYLTKWYPLSGEPSGLAVDSSRNVYVVGSNFQKFALATSFTTSATQSANGVIAPENSTVNYGGDQTFTITPNTGYHITSLSVDGSAVTVASSYTFSNVTAFHTITATFGINTYAITVTQASNGVVAPGTTTANYGATPSFTVTPNVGYYISNLMVDNVPVLSNMVGNTYTFPAVSADHTIIASFAINTYMVAVIQTANGQIAPGTTIVNYGGSQSFTITPNNGYYIARITTNAGSVAVTSSSGQTVSFTNVQAPQTITATFAQTSTPTPTPTPQPTTAPTSATTTTPAPTATPFPTTAPLPTPTPSTAASTSPSPTASTIPNQSSLPQEAIYGIVAAVAIVAIIAVVFVLRKSKKSKS